MVTLTMLRGLPKPAHFNQSKLDLEHIDDDIIYADTQLSLDENFPPTAISTLNERKHQRPMMQSRHIVGDLQAYERSTYKGHLNCHAKQDIVRKYLFQNGSSGRTSDGSSAAAAQLVARKNYRIDGEYEVEVCETKSRILSCESLQCVIN